MKRKKFVKMLMADGYTRNTANAMAEIVVNKGQSYQKAYDALTYFGKIKKSLINGIVPIAKEIEKIVKAVSAGVQAFSDKFRQEISKV